MAVSKTPLEKMWPLGDLAKTRDVVLRYFKDNKQRISFGTAQLRMGQLRNFFGYCKIEYDSVKTEDIGAWLSTLEAAGHKSSSINSSRAALSSFYKHCLKEGLISERLVSNIRLPRLPDTDLHYIDRPTLVQLMELTKKEPKERAMIAILYATGMLVSELLNIRLNDINWDERKIVIRKGKGHKDRLVFFTPECAEQMKDYLATFESPYLFAQLGIKPLSTLWAKLKFRGYTKALHSANRITPFSLRRSFAAHLAEKKMPLEYIQEQLGTESISTAQLYTRVSTQVKK